MTMVNSGLKGLRVRLKSLRLDFKNNAYGIRRSLIVIDSITEVKQRRARFIIGWVTAW